MNYTNHNMKHSSAATTSVQHSSKYCSNQFGGGGSVSGPEGLLSKEWLDSVEPPVLKKVPHVPGNSSYRI